MENETIEYTATVSGVICSFHMKKYGHITLELTPTDDPNSFVAEPERIRTLDVSDLPSKYRNAPGMRQFIEKANAAALAVFGSDWKAT